MFIFQHIGVYMRRYRLYVLAVVLFLLLAKVCNLAVPMFIKEVVNNLGQNPLHAPIFLILAYASMRYLAYFLDECASWLFAPVTEKMIQELSLHVFAYLQKLSVSFHLKKQSGRLHRDIDRGSKGIRSLVSYSIYRILPTIIEITMVLSWLWLQYAWYYGVIVASAIFIYSVYTFKITEWRSSFRKKMNALDSQVSQNTHDALLNFETIKYFDNEGEEVQRYGRDLAELSQATIKNDRTLSILDAGQQLIISISLMAILTLASLDVQSKAITLGDWVLMNSLMLQVYTPLVFLGMMYREMRQALTDSQTLFALLEEKIDVQDAPDAPDLHVAQSPCIRFEDIHFSYDDKRPILKGLDFTVESGTTTAIVGHSGCGKSTLTRLLFRFYDPQQGQIYINDVAIDAVTQASLRKNIAIVSQDTVLFNDTLAYNIRYGHIHADDATWQQAAHLAQLDDFVKQLDIGYDVRVGERGLKLSGGEKQRVAIARALLKNAPILILDEATSALDSKTEQSIQQAFMNLSANRTSLVIAHRLSTIVHAQQILVMDKGFIVERGTHETLLAQKGLYHKMWQQQQKKEAKDQSEHSQLMGDAENSMPSSLLEV